MIRPKFPFYTVVFGLALTIGCFVALGIVLVRTASAQGTCTVSGKSSCTITSSNGRITEGTIARAVNLVVTTAPTAVATIADFDRGYVEFQGASIVVRANRSWTLQISAASATWSATASTSEAVRANKPASELLWATAQAGTYSPLSTTAVTLSSGAAATAGTAVSLWHRSSLNWTLDTPGQYTLGVRLTISAP